MQNQTFAKQTIPLFEPDGCKFNAKALTHFCLCLPKNDGQMHATRKRVAVDSTDYGFQAFWKSVVRLKP